MFTRALSVAVLACGVVWAQATFEVASVKPAPPATGPGLSVRMSQDRGRLMFSNVTLLNILARAYKVKDHQISGPDWLKSSRYDITAKLPEGANKDQVPEMLQALLTERFKLTLHKEQKVLPVYALVLAKSGLKVKPAEDGGRVGISMGPKGRKMTGNMTMTALADMLSNSLDRVVLDTTEVKGTFDISLEWTPEAGEGMLGRFGAPERGKMPPPPGAGEPGGKGAPDGPDAPSIFTAVQEQLGLRLEPKKAPVEIIVIDSAEKVPTEN